MAKERRASPVPAPWRPTWQDIHGGRAGSPRTAFRSLRRAGGPQSRGRRRTHPPGCAALALDGRARPLARLGRESRTTGTARRAGGGEVGLTFVNHITFLIQLPGLLDCAAQRISHVPDMLNPLARFALLSRAPGLTPLPAHEPPESTRLVPTFVGFGTVGHPRPINRAAFAARRHWRLSPLLDGGGIHSVYSTQIGLCNLCIFAWPFRRNGPQPQY
jgi:hypothetical protein